MKESQYFERNGLRRMRPDDHFMVLTETDASPMHIGALVLFDLSEPDRETFAERLKSSLLERLAATPLQSRLIQSPDGFDSDAWADVATIDQAYHVRTLSTEHSLSHDELLDHVAQQSMSRLDLSRPPFEIEIYDRIQGGLGGFYLKVHHAVTDGVGFQTLLMAMSDATSPAPPKAEADLPGTEEWLRQAELRFQAATEDALLHSTRRKRALAAIKELADDPERARSPTPMLKMSGPTSSIRNYATLSLPLDEVRTVARALNGTVNDIFLALCGTAIRNLLIRLDDLPDSPIVANSARSYRRPEHGPYGNRIVALHPHVGTTISAPLERLRAIQASMANERARSPFDEDLLDQPEKPYGARDRRERFAQLTAEGRAVLPGNVTLSNVPGPETPLCFAGHECRANYPVPILGSGRFLNVTSRRNGDWLDLGVMVDGLRIPSSKAMTSDIADALKLYRELAGQ